MPIRRLAIRPEIRKLINNQSHGKWVMIKYIFLLLLSKNVVYVWFQQPKFVSIINVVFEKLI